MTTSKNFDKLVVGGIYQDRKGRLVEIVSEDRRAGVNYPMRSNTGVDYTDSGSFWKGQETHAKDLVELVSLPKEELGPITKEEPSHNHYVLSKEVIKAMTGGTAISSLSNPLVFPDIKRIIIQLVPVPAYAYSLQTELLGLCNDGTVLRFCVNKWEVLDVPVPQGAINANNT